MAREHLFEILPSCGKRRSAVSYELHESFEIGDREVELSKTGRQTLQLVRGDALVRIIERFQYFRGPSACAKSFEKRSGFWTVFTGHGMVDKIPDEAVRALREDGLELDDGLNDTIRFAAAFRRKDLCFLERRENRHGGSDMRRRACRPLHGNGSGVACGEQ
jgi:hypothetical protein